MSTDIEEGEISMWYTDRARWLRILLPMLVASFIILGLVAPIAQSQARLSVPGDPGAEYEPDDLRGRVLQSGRRRFVRLA